MLLSVGYPGREERNLPNLSAPRTRKRQAEDSEKESGDPDMGKGKGKL